MTTSAARPPATAHPDPVGPGSVVVGVDGSETSDLALDWAAETAREEHRPLTLVHSSALDSMVRGSLAMGQPGVDVGALVGAMRAAGHAVLEAAARRAAQIAPDVAVHTVLEERDPRAALLDLADGAQCLVIGSRGRGGVASLLLGSVSVAVATRASCPVVVVRHPAGPGRGGVLVDVDGTDESLAAVELAYRTAATRSWPLTAMYVVWDVARVGREGAPIPGAARAAGSTEEDDGLDADRLLLAESLAGMREKYPEVDDEAMLVHGLRDREVVRASRGRDLVVVGARRGHRLDALLHGAVASTVVEHAACNVAVVPAPSAPVG